MTQCRLIQWLCALTIWLACGAAASAQALQPWSIEVRGGAAVGVGEGSGSGRLPPNRPADANLIGGIPSVNPTGPSWFFGAPVAQVNQSLSFLGRLTALDSILTAPALSSQNRGTFGLTVSRRFGGRWSAELAIDHLGAQTAIEDATSQAIEASRAGFARLFPALPFIISAASTASIRSRDGGELVTTGAATLDLLRGGRAIPFVMFGAGLATRLGEPAAFTLSAEYVVGPRFGIGPVVSIAQTDTVDVRYVLPDRSLVGIVGGGLRLDLTPRWFARFQASGQFRSNALDIVLDAHPTTASMVPGVSSRASTIILPPGGPAIGFQFNSDPSAPQSLAGPPIEDFTTFESSGVQSRLNLSFGIGWRF